MNLTRSLAPEDRVSHVELRRSLRRSLAQDQPFRFFGSGLEATLFGLAAVLIMLAPLAKATLKAKEDVTAVARWLLPQRAVDDAILTGSVAARATKPGEAGKPAAGPAPRPIEAAPLRGGF